MNRGVLGVDEDGLFNQSQRPPIAVNEGPAVGIVDAGVLLEVGVQIQLSSRTNSEKARPRMNAAKRTGLTLDHGA